MRKKDRSLTILVVPHNDSPTITLRFPRWLVPSLIVLAVALIGSAGYFAVRYWQLSERYDELSQQEQTDFERAKGMRTTILTQQDDVKALSDDVAEMESEMDSLRKLSDQVRQLLSLPKAPAPTPNASPTPQSLLIPPGAAGRGGGNAFLPSAPPASMLLVSESTTRIAVIRPQVPLMEKELQYLATQGLKRLSRVDAASAGSLEELQAQLKLLAAAPSAWPVRGPITSDFGWRRALFNPNAREFHTGLDIGVWYYTPVHATTDGTVTYAGWMDGYGNVVEIAHEMGYSTIYGHNSVLKVKTGQEVRAGDVIALSGQTGYANGPHVHYEIRMNGKPVDPMRFVDLGP